MADDLSQLAAFLRGHQDEILEHWTALSEQDGHVPFLSRLTRKEFYDNVPAALQGLCAALELHGVGAVSEKIRDEVAKHGHHRWKQGFNLHELTRDWGTMNRVLIGVIGDFYRAHPADHQPEALAILAEFMTEAMSSSVRRFDELRRTEAASLQQDLVEMKRHFEEATRERGRILREAVHDLRGNLSAIVLTSTLVRLKERGSGPIDDLTDRIERNVRSLQELIDSLLDLSRLESGADRLQAEEADVAAVLGEVAEWCRPQAEHKGLELRLDGPPELAVQTDPIKLKRIVQNLMVNALNYTSKGYIALRWRRESERWLMMLEDTGSGIQDQQGTEIATQLNSPEQTESHPDPQSADSGSAGFVGEGIGLTIVKRLCEILDAGICLESQPGRGTKVTVEFPLEYPES